MQAAGGAPLSEQEAVTGADGRGGAKGGPGGSAGRRRVRVILAVALVVLAADIITKLIVVATLTGRTVKVIGSFLQLTETRNPGAAFSIGGPSETVLFTAIAVGVVVFILRASGRIRSLPWAVTLGLLLGGAMGNLTDRIFRSPGLFRGFVVDWVELPHWPVFNVADSSIVCGGVLAVILALRGIHIDGSVGDEQEREQGDADVGPDGLDSGARPDDSDAATTDQPGGGGA
jgi:signal peptidase II